MEEKIMEVINEGWNEPSNEDQAQAIKKAIDIFIKEDNSGSRVEFLIQLKELIISFIK